MDMDLLRNDEFERKVTKFKLQQMMMSDDERLSSDTYSCECIFLKYFRTQEMEDDFSLIAKEFLRHEYVHLEEYYNLHYVDDAPEASWPECSFHFIILNLMMGAVKQGNEYARSLFCYLHKTYYKKEYRQLKRFTTMSGTEAMSIAEDAERGMGISDLARVLSMARMYGIELQLNCNFLYLYLDDFYQELAEEDVVEFVSFPEGVFDKSAETLEQMFQSGREMIKESDRVDRYMGKVLRYFGYPEDYIYICDEEDFGVEMTFQKTLSLMNMTYPNKQFDKQEIAIHASIFRCISAISSICTRQYENSKEVLGISEDDFFETFQPLFHPEHVTPATGKQNKQSVNPTIVEKTRSGQEPIYKEEALLEEIDRLRDKLHRQEEHNKQLINLVRDGEKRRKEHEQLNRSHEEERQELVALREHVYNFTEFGEVEQINNMGEMKKDIVSRNIVIIGGHDNWVKKLKQNFPTWIFISPNASGAVDKRLLQKAEHVYFFTDTIDHSTYNRFIHIVRAQGIPFGYLHSINIDYNVAQIYQDFT